MAEMRGAARYAQKQQWAKENRAKAKALLAEATEIQNQLFDSGDLTPYLRMLAKMDYQNSYNLLLLTKKLPSATCLSGFGIWQKRMPDPMAAVIKSDQRGKGIELLVPFTDISASAMTWYAAMHFDVSQVRVSYTPTRGPYQPASPSHYNALLNAFQTVLGSQYKTTVSIARDEEEVVQLKHAHSAGKMLPGFFVLRPNLGKEEKLRWLTNATCSLFLQKNGIPEAYLNYASQCATQCLFDIWGTMKILPPLIPNHTLLAGANADDRKQLLDLLQRCVYTLDSQIADYYEDALALDDAANEELATI